MELVFLYISTYALSSTVLPVVQKVKVPVILLNLQPVPRLDYNAFNALGDRGKMTGLWLEHCQACSVPEIAGVLNRASVRYDIITGHLQDEQAWSEIEDWTQAARAAKALRNNRMGILGRYYGGMLDVYTDLTQQSTVFGTHFEMLEMCELKEYRDGVTAEQLGDKISEFQTAFDVDPECDSREIERAALTSIALDKLVEVHHLNSLAYYYEGRPGNEYENIVTSIIAGNTLLTGKNIPVAGECEVKNATAMKIMSELEAGGSFSEFYLMDFIDDVVYLGHDGPAHFAIAEGRVNLVPLPVLSWKTRERFVHSDDGETRPGDPALGSGGQRGCVLPGSRRRISAWTVSSNREYQQPLQIFIERQRVYRPLVETGPGASLCDWCGARCREN